MNPQRNNKKNQNLQTDTNQMCNYNTDYTQHPQSRYQEYSLSKPLDTAYEISPSKGEADHHYLTTSNIDNISSPCLDSSIKQHISKNKTNNNNIITNLIHKTSKTNDNYIILEKLKQKISSQAKRLTELQIYKALCEKHILQLSPNHTLPITEDDITNYELYYNTSPTEQNETNKNVAYLLNEKNKIADALKKETITNEQLRKYNELLKESMDSILLKSNLDSLIRKSYMFNNSDNKYANVYDYIISLSSMVNEIDKKEKEILIRDNKIKELEIDIITLKNELNESENQISSLMDRLNMQNSTYNNMIKEKNNLDYKNQTLIEEINNEKIKKQYQQEISASEKEQYEHIINTLKKELEMSYLKNKDLIKSQNDFQLNNTEISNELNQTKMELNQLQSIIEHKETDIHFLNTKISDLTNKVSLLTKEKEQLTTTNQTLNNETQSLHLSINKMKEMQSYQENQVQTLTNLNTDKSNELHSLQKKYEEDLNIKNEQCKNLQNEVTSLNDQINALQKQIKQTINDNDKHIDNISNANEREKKLREELNRVVTNNKKLINLYENNIDSVKQEIKNTHDNICKNNELTIKLTKLEMENRRLLKNNSAFEEMNKCLISEIEKLRTQMKENEINNYTIITNQNANVKIIDNCYNIISEYISKFNQEDKKDKFKLYLSTLEEFVDWFESNKSLLSNGEKERLKIIEMFISMVSTQSEILFKLFDI